MTQTDENESMQAQTDNAAEAILPQEEALPPVEDTASAAEAVQPVADTASAAEAAEPAEPVDVKLARKRFSRAWLGVGLMSIVTFLVVNIVAIPIYMLDIEQSLQTMILWFVQDGVLYLIGLPICLLLLRGFPSAKPKETMKLGFGKLIGIFCASIFVMLVGAFLSNYINNLLSGTFGTDVSSLLQDNILGMNKLTMIIMLVVIAPVMEEFLFRKVMIDRMRQYGERIAVFASGLMFGLVHGNLMQAFYATFLGWVFGYVYLRTGRLRYTILLHFLVNGLSTIQSLLLTSLDPDIMETMLSLQLSDTEALMSMISPAVIGIVLTTLLQYALGFVGIVMFIIYIRKVYFNKPPQPLPIGKRFTTVFVNVGMLVFLFAVIGQFAVSFIVGSL